jgi:hypothetical protein
MLLDGNAARKFADGLRGLKERIHILRCQPRGECQNHDCAAEQAEFASDTLIAKLVRQSLKRRENLFPRQR